MKRLLFILLTFISLNIFAQSDSFKVKEGSFHKIDGCVTIPARTDVNDLPMGVIKIIPDNINEQQRMRLTFEGNLAMGIEVEPKEGETWVYVTARAVTFLRIKHPDFGVTEFYPPMEIEANQCYEMVLQYVAASESETGFLAISSEPNEADVYVDGKHYGKTTAVVTDLAEGSHTLKLEKQGYVTLTKTINIVKGETLKLNETLQTLSSQKTYLIVKADQPDAMIYIDDEPINTGEASKSVNIGSTHTYRIECDLYHTETGTVTITDRVTVDKKLRPNFGYINVTTSPEQGAKVYVDGKYIGESPIKTDKLASGTHTVRVMKEMFKMKEQTFTVTDGQTTNAALNMAANFVSLTINTDSDSDIYVDGDYKGKGRWTGKLSDGLHNVEARKQNHKPTAKTLDLVLGATQTITLDAPKPINGSIDVNSSPMGATIYIDGKSYGETPNYINNILIGTHELKLEKQGCTTITKTISIKENETLTVNEKLQTGKEIVIKTDKSGDKVYVDNNYVGLSPVTTTITFGSHNLKAERDGKTVSKNIEVSHVETHGRVSSDKEEYMLAAETENIAPAQHEIKGFIIYEETGEPLEYATVSLFNSQDSTFVTGIITDMKGAFSLKTKSGKYYLLVQFVGCVTKTINLNVKDNVSLGKIFMSPDSAFSSNETFTVNGVSFTMIKVEGGTFSMGATSKQGRDAASDEKPVHSVTLSDYYIGETEVTQELWEAVMGSNPSDFKGSQKPVECVSWYDCKEFIEKLNQLTGKNFRLPTEAEWEYAARGGNKSKGYKYSGSNTIDDVAWCYENSGDSGLDGSIWDDDKLEQNNCRTHNVKTKSPNELGIYDMSGNVNEWCEDWYGDYSNGSQTNPVGPSTGSYRVRRGGTWLIYARSCGVSLRGYDDPDSRFTVLGLRLCLYQY